MAAHDTMTASAPRRPSLALSIVSHDQGALVAHLLDDLRPLFTASMEIVVTLNLPEPEDFLRDRGFPVRVIRNLHPQGYGSNHNQAFATTDADFFAVLNPDLRLPEFDFDAVLATLAQPQVAACAPRVVDVFGRAEDSARRFPTLTSIAGRVVQRAIGRRPPADYALDSAPGSLTVDWVAGMFVVFRTEAFAAARGYDEGFFMYLEDADICERLWLNGGEVRVCTSTSVVHDARRATLKSVRHLRWHVRSLLRYLRLSLLRSRVRRRDDR